MKTFGEHLIQTRTQSGHTTAKSFYNYLKDRGLNCNYQYYMKVEKDQAFPSSEVVNQIAKGLSSELAQGVVLAYCQNQFQSFDYLFKTTQSDVVESTETKKQSNISLMQGQRELTNYQISVLHKKQENYFLFLLLTLSRGPVHINEIQSYSGLKESIQELEEAGISIQDDEFVTSTSSEFRFPISEDKNVNQAYADFDLWDMDFSSQFEFENLINKMMIRRISPRYLTAIKRQIDTIADFVRLSDEADQKYNNDVLHLQIKLSRGEIPG